MTLIPIVSFKLPGDMGCFPHSRERAVSPLTEAFGWRFTAPLMLGSTLNPINSSLIATGLVGIGADMRAGREAARTGCGRRRKLGCRGTRSGPVSRFVKMKYWLAASIPARPASRPRK